MGAIGDGSGHAFADDHIHAIALGASSGSIFLTLEEPWLLRPWRPWKVTGFSLS